MDGAIARTGIAGASTGPSTGIAGRVGFAALPVRYRLLTTCARPLWPKTVTVAACAGPAATPKTERTHAVTNAPIRGTRGMRLGIEGDDMFAWRVFCTLPCAL